MKLDIPFNRASLHGNELRYIQKVIDDGWISGNGNFTKKCEVILEEELGTAKALLTTSCTHALEMAAMLLDVRAGDQIIIPSFTFVSTANAFVVHGGSPVFVDIRPDTLNIDESLIEERITENTRAIVPVHYAGVGCEMTTICDIADRHGLAIIEDNAHGLFGTYCGKRLGTLGSMATQSFHETKNLTCGEGGALLINEGKLVERAEILREKGTNRSKMFRGEIDKYTWVDVGSSYVLSEILAAFLCAHLEAREQIQTKRKQIWQFYHQGLGTWAEENIVQLPHVPDTCEQTYHMFYLVMPTGESRDRLISHLREQRILAVFHYQPLHLSTMGKQFGGRAGDCPVTESVSERVVRLPFYNGLTQAEQERVVSAITGCTEWSLPGKAGAGSVSDSRC